MSFKRIAAAVDMDLPPTEKLLLILLANSADDDSGECFPSQQYLSTKSKVSRQTVNRLLKSLAEKGAIQIRHKYRDDGGFRANTYVVLPLFEGTPCQILRQGGVTQGDRGVSDIATAIDSHKETVISKQPPSVSPPKGSRLSEDFELPDDWRDWAKQKRPDLHIPSVFEIFKDHWLSVAGSQGVKRDWLRTWRNWIRRESVQGEKKLNGSRPPWANIPRDDNQLTTFARTHGHPEARVGELTAAYRMRLQSHVQERIRGP